MNPFANWNEADVEAYEKEIGKQKSESRNSNPRTTLNSQLKPLSTNPGDHGLRAVVAEPVGRVPLGGEGGPEETRWHPAAARFEIVFIVYSVRPADYDGYDIKAVQDFLVTAGIITGDDWKTLAGRTVSRQVATQKEERTEIVITAVESFGVEG